MTTKSVFFSLMITFFMGSCALMNQTGTAEDDLYFSANSGDGNKPKMIPTVNIEKIRRDFPSQVDTTKPSGYNDNGTANPNAAIGYPAYKASQDTIYKYNPSYSGYYQPYPMPPFSLRDEYLRAKAERRQQRRLARINSRNNFNNNWGWNNGWNNFGPSLNFGWNSFNGWNTGIGFGWNNWGWNNGWNNWGWNNPWNNWGWNNGWNTFYNPWAFNSFYNPWFYGNLNNNRNENVNPNPPQSRPRGTVGGSLPATNGGTIDNPNPNPQRVVRSNSGTVEQNIQQTTPEIRANTGATLIQTPTGMQYVAPRTDNNAPPTYSTFEKSVENNKVQTEFRSANPQYVIPNTTPVQAPNTSSPNVVPNQQYYQAPSNNNVQRNNVPIYNAPANNSNIPAYNPPVYDTPPRSSGNSNNSSGGGRSSGGNGGGGISRPR